MGTSLSRRSLLASTAGVGALLWQMPAPILRTVIDNQTGRRLDHAGRSLDTWNAAARGWMTRAEIRALEDLPPEAP